MKKLLFILAAIIAFSFAESSSDESNVYICVSKSSEVYHYDEDCRGLKRCAHEVKKVALKEAKEVYGRRICGWED